VVKSLVLWLDLLADALHLVLPVLLNYELSSGVIDFQAGTCFLDRGLVGLDVGEELPTAVLRHLDVVPLRAEQRPSFVNDGVGDLLSIRPLHLLQLTFILYFCSVVATGF